MGFIFDSLSTGSTVLDQHLEHVRRFDWASTSLGPLSSWPTDLLQVAHIMMLDPEPRLLLLGTRNWMIYNPAYATAVAGDKHPELLGQAQAEAWSEVDASVIEAPNEIRDAGFLPETTYEYHVPLMRNGFLEECVLTWTTIPLAGSLTGVYVSLTDVTEAHVAERRKRTLSRLEKTCSAAKSVDSLREVVPQCLSANADDFPFILLCSGDLIETSDRHGGSHYHLERSAGDIEINEESQILLETSPSLQQAAASTNPLLIRSDDEDFKRTWSHSFSNPDPRNAVIVCPLRSNTSEKVLNLLVIGLSSRNPYNETWRVWMNQLTQVLGESVTSMLMAEEESQRRAQARTDAIKRALASEKEASFVTERLLRLKEIVERVDVGVYEYLNDGLLVQSNEAFHSLSGIPKARKGVEPYAFADRVYPEDSAMVLEKWNDLILGNVTTFEMRWKAPLNAYGEDFQWVLAAGIPIADESGAVTSIFGCITNIGPQKRAESQTRARAEALERLTLSERRFYTFMEHAPVAVIVYGSSMQVSYANSNWFELTGYPRTQDFNNIDWKGGILDEDLPMVEALWQINLAGKSSQAEFRLKTLWRGGDGPATPTFVCATAWPEMENGVMKQVICTLTDISHFKSTEGIQRLRTEQAIEAKRQQENFIDMTSHEIRNPLSAVVHCTDAISDSLHEMDKLVTVLMTSREQDKAKQLHEYIEGSMDAANTIKSCTAHQKRIVDDILVLSKLDSNLLQISPSPVEAMTILRNVDKMFEAEAARECVDITVKADESLARMNITWLLLDHGRIDQILINLITNAIKFTKNRDVRNITICMGASEQRPSETDLAVNFDVDFTLGQSMRDSIYDTPDFAVDNELFLWFAVQDTGRGITDEEKSRIFGRFAQASPRTYTEYGGSGLGLYISHSLVGLQGGEIGVATKPGVGSTFSFFVKTTRCPAPVPDATHLSIVENRTRDATQKNGTAKGRISVLIVEDNLLNQRVLKKQLSKNYDVSTADHGQEALDFLKTTRNWNQQPPGDKYIDVILMDLEMPVMGGLECSRTIRDLQRSNFLRGHIPIIAVSANARPEQINEAFEAGMDGAISKPFRIPDLVPKIERLVQGGKAPH